MSSKGVFVDHGLLNMPTDELPGWVEKLALWKGLRLLRLLRIFKILRDVARRKKVWEQRLASFFAYVRAFVEALLIMAGVMLMVVILTKFVSEQDPEVLIRKFVENVITRLRANRDSEVQSPA